MIHQFFAPNDPPLAKAILYDIEIRNGIEREKNIMIKVASRKMRPFLNIRDVQFSFFFFLFNIAPVSRDYFGARRIKKRG